jgi:UDP-N-acetylmuramoylalanine--D-glutamate ligase
VASIPGWREKKWEPRFPNDIYSRLGHSMGHGSAEAVLNMQGKRVLVVGLARTGIAVSRFLISAGAAVTAADLLVKEQLGPLVQEALSMGVSLQLGPHDVQTFLSQDLIVVSPGVPEGIAPIEAARKAGVPVIGELELAVRFIDDPIVAVTGTNGKTTTTNLIGNMLKASRLDVFVGGNIGNPLIEYVSSGDSVDIIVAEVSSFQLDTMKRFKPKVGVLLNISEDHLDRYKDFRAYIHSKGRLFENQESSDFAVLNKADPFVKSVEPNIRAQRLFFNGDSREDAGAELRGGALICQFPERTPQTLSLSEFRLKGKHNLENACAASLAALAVGASASGVQEVLNTFEGLHHRLEHVRTFRGAYYVNDSKGTNVGAVVRALESFHTPVILIMGGRDKGGDYAVLKDQVKASVKKLIVTGEAKEKILRVLGETTSFQEATDLEEAVALAGQTAMPGDVVLLSPGCSSFDMFTDYAERGEAFSRAVEALGNDT